MSSPSQNEPEQSGERRSSGSSRTAFSPQWIVVMLVAIPLAIFLSTLFNESSSRIDYGFLWKQVEAGNVEKASFQGDIVRGKWKRSRPDPKRIRLRSAPNLKPTSLCRWIMN